MKLHLFWSMGMKQKIVSLSPIETVCKLFLAVKIERLEIMFGSHLQMFVSGKMDFRSHFQLFIQFNDDKIIYQTL